MPAKVLITGASGFLGWNFCKKYENVFDITGTYFRNLPDDVNVNFVRINLLETPEISKLIESSKPDVIVHLAAISNAAFCEEHPALSHHINVYSTLALAKASAEQNIPMIFASTDLVFNGNSGPYTEDDFCYPLSQYGLQKQMAEESLLSDFRQVIIARLPLMFGMTPGYTDNFFTSAIKKMTEGETIKAFTDEFRTMISAEVASEWLECLIRYSLDDEISDKQNLFHVAGTERCSRYDFAIKMAEVFELDSSLVIPCLQKDLNLIPVRPPDVSLNSDKAINTFLYHPDDLNAQLLKIKESIFS
jgi:dTDP-4-dehydrorhamnose reductase